MSDVPDNEQPTQTPDTPALDAVADAVATAAQQAGGPRNERPALDRILKMKIPVIVKVAEKQMTVADVLKLNLGSIIQFEKDAYQHVELMVNNSTIGLGQPVKIGENFGLRVMQMGEVTETIKLLGEHVEE